MITLSTLRINNLFNDHCKSLFYLSHIMRKHIYNSILPVSIINSLYQPIFLFISIFMEIFFSILLFLSFSSSTLSSPNLANMMRLGFQFLQRSNRALFSNALHNSMFRSISLRSVSFIFTFHTYHTTFHQ